MICDGCQYETGRLSVAAWHTDSDSHDVDLVRVVAAILTSSTTRALPPEWRGDYTTNRARAWIERRDAEGPTLLVTDRSSETAIGFMILYEQQAVNSTASVDVRLGYVIAERAWSKGYATEAVGGFVRWARASAAISTISAGVEADNQASQRVLEKSRFDRVAEDDGNEQIFQISFEH